MPDKISIYDVGDRYDPSESEGEYDEQEKRLLKDIRGRQGRKKGTGDSDEEEVLGFDDEDDDEDEIQKFEHDSDIEDKEDDDDMPDRKAWGDKASGFYGTDYVDQDYDSLTAQEEERALQEEEEAKEIQKRLAKELSEADFSLDIFVADQEQVAGEGKKGRKKKKEKTEIQLKSDLSDLSERQKRELFRKEAPEFDGLVEDFERNMTECQETLEPVLKYLKGRNVRDHPFVQLLRTRYDLGLCYCNNISFYLLLKSKRMKVKNHPVVKRMVQMKQLLLELEQKYENTIKGQVEEIVRHIESGEKLIFEDQEQAVVEQDQPKHQKRLGILKSLDEFKELEDHGSESEEQSASEDDEPTAKKVRMDSDSEDEPEEEIGEEVQEQTADGKRKITYQMAKNKGLTVHKKKEQRNIRVKNRKKFQKALVRRKGSIRPVKTETTRYAGESSGIKAFVKRSIKLK